MVVLEAMRDGVPVLYPAAAGVSEVVQSGVRIDPANLKQMEEKLTGLLTDRALWEERAGRERKELSEYLERHYEDRILELWKDLMGKHRGRAGMRHATAS
jgi:glycosyltransferase involved in cell wall biosynthesis